MRCQCVGLTNLSPSCANCLEIWDPQLTGTIRACPGLFSDCFTFHKLVRLNRKLQISLLVKEFPFLQVNFHVHSSPPLFPVLTQINIDPTCHNISFFKPILILSFHSQLGLDIGLLPYGFSTIIEISGVNYMDRYFRFLTYSKWINPCITYVLMPILPLYHIHKVSMNMWG
jgi:hypothetical protein